MAAIPQELPTARRRWAVSVGATLALAAACVLVALALSLRDGRKLFSNPFAPQVVIRPTDDSASGAAWLESRGRAEGGETPMFSWPLENTLTCAISPDLFE
jgi:hypothetical protein